MFPVSGDVTSYMIPENLHGDIENPPYACGKICFYPFLVAEGITYLYISDVCRPIILSRHAPQFGSIVNNRIDICLNNVRKYVYIYMLSSLLINVFRRD